MSGWPTLHMSGPICQAGGVHSAPSTRFFLQFGRHAASASYESVYLSRLPEDEGLRHKRLRRAAAPIYCDAPHGICGRTFPGDLTSACDFGSGSRSADGGSSSNGCCASEMRSKARSPDPMALASKRGTSMSRRCPQNPQDYKLVVGEDEGAGTEAAQHGWGTAGRPPNFCACALSAESLRRAPAPWPSEPPSAPTADCNLAASLRPEGPQGSSYQRQAQANSAQP